MNLPPDPRCFAAPGGDAFADLACQLIEPPAAVQTVEGPNARMTALVERYAQALERKEEQAVRASLRAGPTPRAYRAMVEALERALEGGPAAVGARLFAIPVVILAGGRAGATVPGALPDVARLRDVLAQHAALGPVVNFGLGNALCSAEALSALPLTQVRALAQGAAADAQADRLFDLPPAEVHLPMSEASVHLRFLAGAAVSPADAPSFVETASAISTWGVAFTRELSAQLQSEGVSLLAIPRPPAPLLSAQASGAIAAEDLALQAFVSRELRRFRSEVGEPDVAIAALSSGALGLRLASVFVENRVFVHERRLQPSEDWAGVLGEVVQLLEECRIENLHLEPGVMDPAAFRAGTLTRH